MNRLFDLRFVIGAFFLVTGILLVIYGFSISEPIDKWCGALFVLFGVVMVFLSYSAPAEDEKERG